MMIFVHFSKVRRFFSLKEAIVDLKCKTKKLNIALNFHNQKSVRRYDDSVRRNLIFRSVGGKFLMSILWRKKFDNIDFFIFIATDPIFRHFWFSLLISLNNCLYLMCVKAENKLASYAAWDRVNVGGRWLKNVIIMNIWMHLYSYWQIIYCLLNRV